MASYKDFNREIKGYVEVEYNVLNETHNLDLFYDNGLKTYEIVNVDSTTPLQEIFDTNRKNANYAILEENYTSLDGNFLLFDKVKADSGFISGKTVDEYIELGDTYGSNTQICLSIGTSEDLFLSDVYGVTIYTKNNPIISCNITMYDSDYNVIEEQKIEDNDNSILLLIFNNSLKGHFIYMTNIEFKYKDRRIMLNHIDTGISYIYENNELIEFTVTEEVDKLVEKTPANELELTIGDYEQLYNPLNPVGITKFLTEKTTFIPYIGIANDNGKIEYTKMGEFYYDSINYQDKQVTITSYNLMNELSKVMIKNTNGSLAGTIVSIPISKLKDRLITFLSNCYNYSYDIDINNESTMFVSNLTYESLAIFLQQSAMFDGIFYVDRDKKIVVREIDKTIVEKISRSELLNDISYKNLKNYKSYYLKLSKVANLSSSSTVNETENFSTTFILKNNVEEICITSNDPKNLIFISTDDLSYSGATNVEVLGYSSDSGSTVGKKTNYFIYMLFLKVTGEVGAEVTISGKKTYVTEANANAEENLLIGADNETNIIVDNPLIYGSSKSQKFIDKMYSYESSFSYNGNPLIKAGDYIEVESNYGYIPLFVIKHVLTYDGGLSGSIEGVE